MVYGVGTDIVQMSRIASSLAQGGERFAAKILGPAELAAYHARAERNAVRALRYLATRFAAKEALSKAIDLGMRWPMSWHAAEALNADSGKPVFTFHGALDEHMRANRLSAALSVSDEVEYAVAFVIVTQAP